MKKLLSALLFLCFCLPLQSAAAESPSLRVGVIDEDPKGTNLRDAPSGKVIAVIPLEPRDDSGDLDLDQRVATLLEKRGDWFRVKTTWKDKEGWMHKSVLGGYSSAGEEGDCHSFAGPSWDAAPSQQRLPYHTFLTLEDMQRDWGKFSFAGEEGAKQSAWLPQQCVETFRYPLTLEDEHGKSVTLGYSEARGFFRYANDRFGFSVDIPYTVTDVRVIPDNGDGVILGNEEQGVTFTASCMNNVLEKTAGAAYEELLAEAGTGVRSKRLDRNEYTVSWKNGDAVELRRGIVTKELVCAVSVVYPEAGAAAWESRAAHSAASFAIP